MPWPDDACEGDDATGDTDGDGWCDDLDVCLGDDTTRDADGDGVCADDDCDDQDPNRSALLGEPPGNESDEDCDGAIICWLDDDGDGFSVDTPIPD